MDNQKGCKVQRYPMIDGLKVQSGGWTFVFGMASNDRIRTLDYSPPASPLLLGRSCVPRVIVSMLSICE